MDAGRPRELPGLLYRQSIISGFSTRLASSSNHPDSAISSRISLRERQRNLANFQPYVTSRRAMSTPGNALHSRCFAPAISSAGSKARHLDKLYGTEVIAHATRATIPHQESFIEINVK